MSFTIFQKEKSPFQLIKTKRFKSRKIDIFQRGKLMVVVQKWQFFQIFFWAIQARKMSFTIFQNETTPSQAIKTKSSHSRKFDIFPKGLTHGFGLKMAILPTFFLGGGNISQGNVLYDTQERKNAFLDYKGKKFQRGKPIVLVQKWPFFQLFFLGNIGQENVF